MRFFLPGVPAGRLEFLAIMLPTFAVQFWAAFSYLELEVDIANRGVSYVARNLELFALIYVAMLAIQWITSMRRLRDLDKSGNAAFLALIPGLGAVFALMLFVSDTHTGAGYAPFGDDPLSPDSWVERPDGKRSAPAVTFQGQELSLPGEEHWDDQSAA